MRKGQITKKDYEKHLKSLDDVADKQAPIELATTTRTTDRTGAPTASTPTSRDRAVET